MRKLTQSRKAQIKLNQHKKTQHWKELIYFHIFFHVRSQICTHIYFPLSDRSAFSWYMAYVNLGNQVVCAHTAMSGRK